LIEVEKYIQRGFYDSNYVVLPGFGGFVLSYRSANIDNGRHVITPPAKGIAFNAKLSNNDGYLASVIAEGEGISIAEATIVLSQYVQQIQQQLRKSGNFSVPGVGSFYSKNQGLLEFEPDKSINYLRQSFALPEIMISPIKRQEKSERTFKNKDRMAIQQPQKPVSPKTNQEKSGSKTPTGPILAVLFLLFSFSGTYLIFYNQKNISHGSLNPVEWINHQDEIISDSSIVALGAERKEEVDTIEDVSEENPNSNVEDLAASESSWEDKKDESLDVNKSFSEQDAAAKDANTSQILDTHTKRYFVIVGGFKDPDKALLLRDKLEGEGVDSKILQPAKGNTLYRVSVADFPNFDQAMEKSNELRPKFGDSIWVLVYDLGK
jgi:nucleoid DNA-binding protein